jgi:hypothetical protein
MSQILPSRGWCFREDDRDRNCGQSLSTMTERLMGSVAQVSKELESAAELVVESQPQSETEHNGCQSIWCQLDELC